MRVFIYSLQCKLEKKLVNHNYTWQLNVVLLNTCPLYRTQGTRQKTETNVKRNLGGFSLQFAEGSYRGDSKICLEAIIKNGPEIPWKIDAIIKDIWNITSHIPSVKHNWIDKGCNVAAHTLAAWSCTMLILALLIQPLAPLILLSLFQRRPVYMYKYLSF